MGGGVETFESCFPGLYCRGVNLLNDIFHFYWDRCVYSVIYCNDLDSREAAQETESGIKQEAPWLEVPFFDPREDL